MYGRVSMRVYLFLRGSRVSCVVGVGGEHPGLLHRVEVQTLHRHTTTTTVTHIQVRAPYIQQYILINAINCIIIAICLLWRWSWIFVDLLQLYSFWSGN